jgi:putative hydrolase of the HAD superfamily
MKRSAARVTCLFLDIGGVLLTDGWDHHARRRAATHFDLDRSTIEARHHLTFETYEEGRLTLDQYLDLVIFPEKRPFTRARFRRFMFAQSRPFPEMIALMTQIKARHGVKIVVVSNEGRELNEHRVRTFKLDALVDAFVSSSFVHRRKPDAEIFRLAQDIAQVPVERTLYIEDTAMFVRVAESLGIRSILHTDMASTRRALASFGLRPDGSAIHAHA